MRAAKSGVHVAIGFLQDVRFGRQFTLEDARRLGGGHDDRLMLDRYVDEVGVRSPLRHPPAIDDACGLTA